MVFTPEPETLSHYNYDPSFEAAIAVGVLYSLAFFVTFFQWLRYNAGVWATMVIAAASEYFSSWLTLYFWVCTKDNSVVEGAGYIIRALSTKHVTEKSIYVAQTALIVLSPVLMAAACYIIFVSPSSFQAELSCNYGNVANVMNIRGESFITSSQRKHEPPSSSGFPIGSLPLFS